MRRQKFVRGASLLGVAVLLTFVGSSMRARGDGPYDELETVDSRVYSRDSMRDAQRSLLPNPDPTPSPEPPFRRRAD